MIICDEHAGGVFGNRLMIFFFDLTQNHAEMEILDVSKAVKS